MTSSDPLRETAKFTPVERCPWCGRDDATTIATRADGIPVMRCPGCDLAYTGRLPDDLGVFYDDDYFSRNAPLGSADALTGYENYRHSFSPSSFRWLALMLKECTGPGATLLDVGAATGTFLEVARYEGFEVVGSELIESAALEAQAKGLDVRPGPFDASAWTGTFDVVTTLETLEHVREPGPFLEALWGKVADGGLLVFFVPHVPQSLVDRHGDASLEFVKSLEHTLYFSDGALRRICDELFGPGRLTLLTSDVPEGDQTVSYALGLVRKGDLGPDRPERDLLALVDGGELSGLEGLSSAGCLGVCLAAAKFYHFELADTALAVAISKGATETAVATVRAQLLRNSGRLLDAMATLGALLDSLRPSAYDPMAGTLFTEVLEEFLGFLGYEPELGQGLRELHAAHDELVSLRSRVEEQAQQFEEVNASWDRDRERLTQARGEIEQLEKQLEKHRQQQSDAASRIALLLKAAESAETEAESMEAELHTIWAAKTNAEARAASAEGRAIDFEEQLNAIYGSRLWRLVGLIWTLRRALGWPVRALRSAFAGRDEDVPVDTVASIDVRPEGIARRPTRHADVLVSVIMPVYNKGPDLLVALESVDRQTLADVEVILWDDGSTDAPTLDALGEAERRFRFVRRFTGPNQGVVRARNSAMAVARGKYLACLDPDDRWAPTYLEKAVALLEADPSVHLAYPWMRTSGDREEVWETQDLVPSLIAEVNHVPVCAVMRWEVFAETGGFSTEMVEGYEDWEFWANAAEHGFRGRVIPEPLFEYSFKQSQTESRDANAREQHLTLATRISTMHPGLRRPDADQLLRPATSRAVRSDRLGQLPRDFPQGRGRPIVLTIPWLTVGGADRVVEELVSRWVEEGRTVVVLVTLELHTTMTDRFVRLLELTPFAYYLPRLADERFWQSWLVSILDAFGGNVAWVNIGSPWAYTAMAHVRKTFPDVSIIDQQFNDLGHFEANLAASDFIDVTVVAYSKLADKLMATGRSRDRLATIYVGIDRSEPVSAERRAEARRLLGASADQPLVTFVGRLSVEKRPEWVIDLARQPFARDLAVGLVGNGPLRPRMTGMVGDLRNVTWISESDDVAAAMAASTVLVVPSRTEGIPLVVMEALSLGTPVVATRVGGLPELDGTDGLTLCDPDDFNDFCASVETVLGTRSDDVALPDWLETGAMVRAYEALIDGSARSVGHRQSS